MSESVVGYRVDVDYPSITCDVCGMRSFHPMDIKEGYCGRCHAYTALFTPAEVEQAVMQLHQQDNGLCMYCTSRRGSVDLVRWPCEFAGRFTR